MKKLMVAVIALMFASALYGQVTTASLSNITGTVPVYFGQSGQVGGTLEVSFQNTTIAPANGQMSILYGATLSSCAAVLHATAIAIPCAASSSLATVSVGGMTLGTTTLIDVTPTFDLTSSPPVGTQIVALVSFNFNYTFSNGQTIAVAVVLSPPPPPPPPDPSLRAHIPYVVTNGVNETGLVYRNTGTQTTDVTVTFTDLTTGAKRSYTFGAFDPGKGDQKQVRSFVNNFVGSVDFYSRQPGEATLLVCNSNYSFCVPAAR